MSAPTLTDKQRELLRELRHWRRGVWIFGGAEHATARALHRRRLISLQRLPTHGSEVRITAKGLRALTAAGKAALAARGVRA
jgi:uncharacterized protein YjhX (UPF0386 family)